MEPYHFCVILAEFDDVCGSRLANLLEFRYNFVAFVHVNNEWMIVLEYACLGRALSQFLPESNVVDRA